MPSILEIRSGHNAIISGVYEQGDLLQAEASEQVALGAVKDICQWIAEALRNRSWSDLLRHGKGLRSLLGARHSTLAASSKHDPALILRLAEDIVGIPWEIIPVGETDRLLGETFDTGRMVIASPRWSEKASPRRGLLRLPVRLLIVADSGLTYAVKEAKSLREMLLHDSRFLQPPILLMDPDPKDLVDALALYEVDILHFAGHGETDQADPLLNGWRLGKELFNESYIRIMAGIDKWPTLVFANACPSTPLGKRPVGHLGADGIAVSLLRHGVRHYISTISEIRDDEYSVRFAFLVYDGLLRGSAMGAALRQAREALSFDEDGSRHEIGSITAAHYLLYGDPSQRLFKPPSPPAPPAPVTEVFGPYTLGAKLGESPYRHTYRAQSGDPEHPQVVVSLPTQFAVEKQADAYRALQPKLRQPGLVPILDVKVYNGRLLVAYEMVKGRPPDVSHPRSLEDARQLVEQVAAALEPAHRQGMCHCELSPNDILISPDGAVRVLDAGRAEVLQRAGLPLQPRNEAYRSPEQWAYYPPRQEAAADLWALAVIAYQLFTGHHPFESAHNRVGNWREAVTGSEVDAPESYRPELSPPLARFLKKTLSRSADDRYRSLAEFVAALGRAFKGREREGGFNPDLELALETSASLFYVNTDDESDTVERLQRIAGRMDYPFYLWSLTSGLTRELGEVSPNLLLDPLGVIRWISEQEKPAMLVLLDYDAYLDDWPLTTAIEPYREVGSASSSSDPWDIQAYIPEYQEREDNDATEIALPKAELRQMITDWVVAERGRGRRGRQGHKMIIVSRGFVIPSDLSRYLQTFVAKPPSHAEVEGILTKFGGGGQSWGSLYAWHAVGLTASAIRDSLRLSLTRHDSLTEAALQDLQREKEQEVRRSGLLEMWRPADAGEGALSFAKDVIGLNTLREWFVARRASLDDPLLAGVLPRPKGVVLGGLPGTGKSFCAQAMAGELGWPLLRLDIGRIFTGLLGKAESNMRDALALAQKISPAVLWIDDLDKSFGQRSASSGVSGRVLQTFLNWLQERESYVFLVATISDPQGLPAELVRAGRFDAIFFLDLPGPGERAQLIEHYLRRQGRNAEGYDFERLVEGTQNLSGAEIVGRIDESFFIAAAQGRLNPTPAELETELTRIPVAPGKLRELERLRQIWLTVATPASFPEPRG